MKKWLLILCTFALTTPAWASEKGQTLIDIKVNGMVCDFCAQSVWKVFYEYDAVEQVDIDLSEGLVTITLKPDTTLDDTQIDEGITHAGYDLVDIKKRVTP